MRILLVTEASSAGVGRHILDLAEGLLQRDHQVDLLYSPLRIDNTFVQRLERMPEMTSVPIEMRRAPHLHDWKVMQRIRSYINARGPFDVIHAHSSKAGAVTRLRRLGSDAARIYTPHCIFTMNPQLSRVAFQATRAIERFLARRATAIIAVSPEERDHIVELGVDSEKVHFVANAISGPITSDAVEARRRLGLPERGLIVGFLGRLGEQKDPLMLLRAFALLKNEFPHAHLAIAGSGPLDSEGRRLAEQLGIRSRVHWLGFQTPESVFPALDVFALPSRYEGMPYVLLEALAAGLPIVATPVGGTSLAVEEKQNGIVTPTHTPSDFAAALRPLLASREMRERYGRASRTKSLELTADAMVDKTCEIYGQLVPASEPVPVMQSPSLPVIPGPWSTHEESNHVYECGSRL